MAPRPKVRIGMGGKIGATHRCPMGTFGTKNVQAATATGRVAKLQLQAHASARERRIAPIALKLVTPPT